MTITELISTDGIAINTDVSDRDEAFGLLIDLHVGLGNVTDPETFKKSIYEREAKGTTALGFGISVPHAKSPAVRKAGITAMTTSAGVDCKSMDGEASRLFFMIAAPDGEADVHLDILACLMKLLMDHELIKKLTEATSPDEFINLIREKEKGEAVPEKEKKSFFKGFRKQK